MSKSNSMPHAHTMHRYSLQRAIFVKFTQLILRKIIKIVTTRCQILMLKCAKLYFHWGCIPDPARGLTVPLRQTPYLDLRGPTFNGKG